MGCSFRPYFHYHGASLTRASSPSSYVFPTMWATVDPLRFSQFDTLGSKLLTLTPELGKAQSQDPREAVLDIAQARFLLGELDIVAQDSALLRRRDVIQDLNIGITHVLPYKELGLALRFPSPPPPLRGLHQIRLVTQEGPGRA